MRGSLRTVHGDWPPASRRGWLSLSGMGGRHARTLARFARISARDVALTVIPSH
jgi:hypothetical protein